jgi:EAL and modified HD-GYP domain-containing signal transduction protein
VNLWVARQPILDAGRQVRAYELLFRSGPENLFQHLDVDDASRRVIENAFNTFGLDTLAGHKKLFINCTRKILLEGAVALFPPEVAVVEVLETVAPEPEVLRAVQDLKRAGYTIALDDFVDQPGYAPLVALADVIKVDFLLSPPAERAAVVERLSRPGLSFLAEKVEGPDEFAEGQRLGYSLFQGYFFARPEMLRSRELQPGKLARLRLMKELLSDQVDYDALEQTIKADLALSLKLLRYLNSASFGWRSSIDSIKRALVLLGDRPFRQWATLVVMTTLAEDQPEELVISSLVRARLCEQVALATGRPEVSFDLFLAGLLSGLEAILGRPLPELLELLAVPGGVRRVLLHNDGELRLVYGGVRAYERGAWDDPALAQLSATCPQLPELYRQAIAWAQSVVG